MPEIWTILKLLEWSTPYLQNKGIPSPRLDAELLLAHTLRLSRVQLYTQFDRPLTEVELQQYKTFFKRRSEREPLAYILGKKEFYSLEFEVSPAVLIPRPETELLVEKTMELLKNAPAPSFDKGGIQGGFKIMDLGTGSGCIPISLAKHLPQAQLTAIDFSEAALNIAKSNAKKHGVEEQINFLHQDIFNLELNPGSKFDAILSNPPYIPEADFLKLEPELTFEPSQALIGGKTGLDFYEHLFPWAKDHLHPSGFALFEIGFNQAEEVEKIATNTGFQKVNILRDYAGHPRMILLFYG